MGFKKKWARETSDHILSLAWSENALIVTPSTGTFLLVDQDGETTAEFAAHGLGNGAADARAGLLATCGFDGQVRTYAIDDSKFVSARAITLGKGWIDRVRWSPNGEHLASALGKTLFVFNGSGEVVGTYSNHKTSVTDFAWNPQDPLEIASVCGGGAQMWRVGETEPFARFDWGGASLLALWSPDGRWLATGDQTPSVHLYDFTRDYPLHIQGFETKVRAIDFSPDGKRLATGGGTTVTIWNCAGKTGPESTIPDQLTFHKGDVEAIAWSPTGTLLATADRAGRLVLSNAQGRPVAAFEDAEGISALAWSPDGKCLAVGDAGGRVVLFSD
ncbi:MAG TPA: WD40 repeat domain-containing protein [Terrimicrobiaceae bacterium]